MKKYIKPFAKLVNVTTAIMAGSLTSVEGVYDGQPLKAKEDLFYDFGE